MAAISHPLNLVRQWLGLLFPKARCWNSWGCKVIIFHLGKGLRTFEEMPCSWWFPHVCLEIVYCGALNLRNTHIIYETPSISLRWNLKDGGFEICYWKSMWNISTQSENMTRRDFVCYILFFWYFFGVGMFLQTFVWWGFFSSEMGGTWVILGVVLVFH